jgi:hypothetical protein
MTKGFIANPATPRIATKAGSPPKNNDGAADDMHIKNQGTLFLRLHIQLFLAEERSKKS